MSETRWVKRRGSVERTRGGYQVLEERESERAGFEQSSVASHLASPTLSRKSPSRSHAVTCRCLSLLAPPGRGSCFALA